MPRGNRNLPPGPGRPKGSKNKATASIKEAFREAFEELGGSEALVKWALSDEKNKTEFYKLSTKLIPTEISGPDGGPIQHSVSATDEEILKRWREGK